MKNSSDPAVAELVKPFKVHRTTAESVEFIEELGSLGSTSAY